MYTYGYWHAGGRVWTGKELSKRRAILEVRNAVSTGFIDEEVGEVVDAEGHVVYACRNEGGKAVREWETGSDGNTVYGAEPQGELV